MKMKTTKTLQTIFPIFSLDSLVGFVPTKFALGILVYFYWMLMSSWRKGNKKKRQPTSSHICFISVPDKNVNKYRSPFLAHELIIICLNILYFIRHFTLNIESICTYMNERMSRIHNVSKCEMERIKSKMISIEKRRHLKLNRYTYVIPNKWKILHSISLPLFFHIDFFVVVAIMCRLDPIIVCFWCHNHISIFVWRFIFKATRTRSIVSISKFRQWRWLSAKFKWCTVSTKLEWRWLSTKHR